MQGCVEGPWESQRPAGTTAYTARAVLVQPRDGRPRAAAAANLTEVILAQVHWALKAGTLHFGRPVVDVLIAADAPSGARMRRGLGSGCSGCRGDRTAERGTQRWRTSFTRCDVYVAGHAAST